MYIDPFWAGVVAGGGLLMLLEIATVVIFAIKSKRQKGSIDESIRRGIYKSTVWGEGEDSPARRTADQLE